MFEKLLGVIADENNLFELIQFEVEANFDHFNVNSYEIILKSLENKQFKVEKIVWRNDPDHQAPPIQSL